MTDSSGSAALPKAMKADLALDCRNLHGEGVLWNSCDRKVWWTDIHGKAVHWFHPESGAAGKQVLGHRLCAFGPRREGGWVAAFDDAIEICDSRFQIIQRLHPFEPDKPGTRLNDGKTDRNGNFVVGGYDERTGRPITSVLRVGSDHRVEELISGITCANAICFSPAGDRMYFADTPTRRVLSYPYGSDRIGKPELLADLSDMNCYPDGACIDSEGGIWIALWEGSGVLRIDISGRITHRIEVPVPRVTCCAFGGPELATLYISTSRLGATGADLAAAPLSGSLFAAETGFSGIEDCPYGLLPVSWTPR